MGSRCRWLPWRGELPRALTRSAWAAGWGSCPSPTATRHSIGEEIGILMARHRIAEEEAFDVLRRFSQENNMKLREVARRVCEQGGTV
ncbi:ANTAR domain-containing protein [Streptomyces sp. NPDC058308]|uniref:ANTAR domain-containing protein n=1 Tax=Streptomyces sp. NPDC058308 TaxID=3346440 RepID=UPI0036E553D5